MIIESYEDIIILSGALRSNFWESIHTAISLTLKRHPTGVIIDCNGITECTSAGAETFIDAMDFIEEHDARIIVARVPEKVMEVLRSVPEVRSQLPIAKTVEEARKSLDLLHEEPDAKKKKPHAAPTSKILLLLAGDETDKVGAFAAIRQAEIMNAEVVVASVIVVPRDLPEQAPMPDKEEAAKNSINAVLPLFERDNILTKKVIYRGRDIGAAVEELMEEEHAQILVAALSTNPMELESEMKLVRSVIQKVKQSVMFVRPPLNDPRIST